MPVKVTKTPKGNYKVTTPLGVHAKGTTKQKAMAQKRIIEESEGKHGRRK